MGIFNKTRKISSPMDEIRCDEPSYLIWKWHPSGVQSNKNTRENAIRWGSTLRVKDGEVAVFVYKQKNGTMQDFIIGPFDQTIKTANFPVLSNIVGLAYGGDTPFQAEIYFINLAHIVQVKFAVPYFNIYDLDFPDFGVPVAVRGTISFHITDYREFIKLHRLSEFKLEDFQYQIRDTVSRHVKNIIASTPAVNGIHVLQIENKIEQINNLLEHTLSERLQNLFGIAVSAIDIGAIEIDKSSDEYRQYISVTRDLASITARAQADAKIKDISDKQRIEATNYEELLRIQREEEQYQTRMNTRTANLTAYQTEVQANVGIAGANALGEMGKHDVGNINLGSNSDFNPVSMMAGMTVGNTVGQNIANTISTIFPSQNSQVVPPPLPTIAYYIAINGKSSGPYDINIISQLITAQHLLGDTLVWRNGMDTWRPASSIEELKTYFSNLVPPSQTK